MILELALILASLVAMGVWVVRFLVNVINKYANHKAFSEYLRSFKKGKSIVLYICAIPICIVVSMAEKGYGFFGALLISFNKVVDLLVLKFDPAWLDLMVGQDIVVFLYKLTISLLYVLSILNASFFVLSITHQWLSYWFSRINKRGKNKLIIIGNNKNSQYIYNSDKKHQKVIIGKISKDEATDLYLNEVDYVVISSYENAINEIFKHIEKRKEKYTIIVNAEDENLNIEIGRLLLNNIICMSDSMGIVKEDDIEKYIISQWLEVYIFGDMKYATIYGEMVKNGRCCINFINKYQKIAVDFIQNHPLSLYLNENQIDYKTSLIKEGVEINGLLIGFGKTNQQIFTTSVANNQFICQKDGEINLKLVNYYLFDKENTKNNKNLNHTYYRYKNWREELFATLTPKEMDELYLPLPDLPANEPMEEMGKLDINDPAFYSTVKKIITRSKNDLNFVVVAFGSDLENIDMAQKLIAKSKEWGVSNLIVFVKSREIAQDERLISENNCYFIANEKDVVYNIDKIDNDFLIDMTKQRDNLHSDPKKWSETMTYWERDSSMYCVLSLRSKLNLMGLDYCKKNGENDSDALSNEEYLNIYAPDDKPRLNKKNEVQYGLEFNESSRRYTMAIQEHLRWNSYLLSIGMVPSSKDLIRKEFAYIAKEGKEGFTNGKSYELRRHGNLTTFEGLVEFREIVAKREFSNKRDDDKRTYEDFLLSKDVIKYDFQILDDAHSLLDNNGYKIIKKK